MSLLCLLLVVVASTCLVFYSFKSRLYDAIVCRMTAKWYAAVLRGLKPGQVILDVGIGTASSLLRNRDLIKEKRARIVGIDLDKDYARSARRNILREGLEDVIDVRCASIFDPTLRETLEDYLPEGRRDFDCAYFSGSWTLMPTPVLALRIAASMVKPEGKIFVTQTFQRKSIPMLGVIKPLLKYITTIDFGKLHYENDLARFVEEANTAKDGMILELEKNTVITDSIDNQFQSARLLVFKKVFVDTSVGQISPITGSL